MFGIGGFELFIILIFGFLIFGPDKLPEIAKTVGKGIARFREAQQEVNDAIGDEKLIDFDNPDQPFKDPMETLDRIAQRHEDKKAAAEKGASSAESAREAADGENGAENDAPKQESFTERKARYERERAARKAAEAEAKAKDNAAGSTTAEPAANDAAVEIGSATGEADAVEKAAATGSAPGETAPTSDASSEGGDA